MKRYIRTILTIFILLCSFSSFAKTDTTYPLYGITPGNPQYTDEDIQILGKNFNYFRGKATHNIIDALHKVNPDFKIVGYFSSGTFGLDATAKGTETLYRKQIAMFGVGKLARKIT